MFLVPDTAVPGGERVKLLDFGIAKFLTHSLSQTTAMDVVMGTPRYMAPEQCEGRDKVDSKVDVYSLGVIFYELLSGTRPFDAQTPQAIMRQHLNMRPPALRERAPWVGERLAQLVHGMLAKDGAKRPSMAQVQERLAVDGRGATMERLRHPAVIAVTFTLLSSGGFMLWRQHEHARGGHSAGSAMPAPVVAPASAASAPAPMVAPAASPSAMSAPASAATAGAAPSPASGQAGAAPGSATASGVGGEPTPKTAAPAVAAGPPPTPTAAENSAPPAASRSVRLRGQRPSGRRVQPAVPPPAPKEKPAGGILKAIDFGKH